MIWAPPDSWAVTVLAAGKGKRMGSELPKVLHEADGRPLLGHVLDTAAKLGAPRVFVIVGHGRDQVVSAFSGGEAGGGPAARGSSSRRRPELVWVDQIEQKGTGDAVLRLGPHLAGWTGQLVVLYGDVPLLRATTLAGLIETHVVQENAATILTAVYPDPSGYGRILRDGDGNFAAIREHADLGPGEETIREINSGIGVFRAPEIFEALTRLRPDNAQGEYYLTDVIGLLRGHGKRVGTHTLDDPDEISGVNSPAELEGVGKILAARREGDPGRCRLCDPSPALDLCETGLATLRLHPHPYNSGHLVVAPKRHVIWYSSLTSGERREVGSLAARGERAVRDVYETPGVNIGFPSGESGGLGHFRVEVIPRWGGDANFMQLVGRTNLVPEDLAATRKRILAGLEGAGSP